MSSVRIGIVKSGVREMCKEDVLVSECKAEAQKLIAQYGGAHSYEVTTKSSARRTWATVTSNEWGAFGHSAKVHSNNWTSYSRRGR